MKSNYIIIITNYRVKSTEALGPNSNEKCPQSSCNVINILQYFFKQT